MKKLCIAVLAVGLLATTTEVNAQTKNQNAPALKTADQMPVPTVDLSKYISENLKMSEYPSDKLGTTSRVYIEFVVNEVGKTTNFKIVKGEDAYLAEHAIGVLHEMPNWKPGKQDGKPVSVYYVVPVVFEYPATQPTK